MNNIAKDLSEAAKQCANNHAKFKSFGWSDEPEDSEQWAVIYLSTRDSGCLDKSNEAVILRELAPWIGHSFEESDVVEQSHGHWAVGHVDGIVIRVYRDGQITQAFKVYHKLALALADYPVLDESDFSEREYEMMSKDWENWGRRDFRKHLISEAPHHEDLFWNLPDAIIDATWYEGEGEYECDDHGTRFIFNRRDWVASTGRDWRRAMIVALKERHT